MERWNGSCSESLVPDTLMLLPGPAKKVTIHLNDDTPSNHDFLYREILTFLLGKGVAGATLIRPEAGFGAHHRMHELSQGPSSSDHMPVRIEFIESAEKASALLPELCELMTDGLLEAHDITIYKAAHGREFSL